MNLVIDSGNTFIKLGIFEKGRQPEFHFRLDEKQLIEKTRQFSPKRVIISSVKNDAAELASYFKESSPLIFNSKTPLPVGNLYKTPETLGADRIAAVIGAKTRLPE